MFKTLVIAGTVDARQIIEELLKLDTSVTATVTTRLGGSFLKQYEEVDVREGRLTLQGMIRLMDETKPGCLIDASHPFARDASCNAIEACKRMCVPYLRYERPKTEIFDEWVIRVRDFEEAVDRLSTFPGKFFLAIGSRRLEVFTQITDYKSRIFVRVLPDSQVIKKCEKLGFNAENIIAIKGPFSETMNMETLKHCNASVMVTKDSGNIGGNAEKINAARKMGVPVIMIERPYVDYGFVVNTVDKVVEFVRNIAAGGNKQ